MKQFIQNLFNLNTFLIGKVRSVQMHDEGLSKYEARNYKGAFPLILEAAKLGNPQSMSILGSMYLLGQGTKEDGVQAVFWLTNAVELQFEGAESVLGMAYATGKAGVKADIPKAQELLARAASRGDEQSARMLAMMCGRRYQHV